MADLKDCITCKQALENLPGLLKGRVGTIKGPIQFDVGEPDNYTAHFDVNGDEIVYHEGPANNPILTVTTPGDLWLKIMKGEKNGQMAFMTGKFKASGDLGVLLTLSGLL